MEVTFSERYPVRVFSKKMVHVLRRSIQSRRKLGTGSPQPPLGGSVKSLLSFWSEVLNELGTWCHASTSLDLKKVEARFEHEGLSFLTITLPTFASDLQKGLELGYVDPFHFAGFQRRGGLPLFLGGFLDRVFDRSTGRLLDDPCKDSIFAIRQLTLLFSKILLPCSEEREEAAFAGYIQCEKEIRDVDRSTTPDVLSNIRRLSTLLWGDRLSSVDLAVYEGSLVPRHGPGATADRLRGNAKYDLCEWTDRLEAYFPYGEFAIPNWRYRYLMDRTDHLEPGAERPVKVISVPKTLKTPRIIAIEPTCMQYTQQAIMEKMIEVLEAPPSKGRVNTSALIGFTDQTFNQRLAREGSLNGELATLDLSEASDRVSNQLVRALFGNFPHLRDAVESCRSRKADVPGYGVQRLAKFASMGSALTFPVEAMVFVTLIFYSYEQELRRPLTRKDVISLSGKVRAYGDDLVVPVSMAERVIATLEDFGLRVNRDKSFWNGKFRESCGKDFYDGHDVSVVRCRRVFPTRRDDVPEILSIVSLRNQMYYSGLWHSARWLDDYVEDILPYYPVVEQSSPVLGRHSFLGHQPGDRFCDELHVPLVRGYVTHSKPPASKVSGEGALLKWFLKRGPQPFADRDHLERQGRPNAVSIKLRWAQPF